MVNGVVPSQKTKAAECCGEESMVQQDLIAWRQKMREECRQRLRAATTRAGLMRAPSQKSTFSGPSTQSKLGERECSVRCRNSHKQLEKSEMSELQRYSLELCEAQGPPQGGKENLPWFMAPVSVGNKQMKRYCGTKVEGSIVKKEPHPQHKETVRAATSLSVPSKQQGSAFHVYKDELAVCTTAYKKSSMFSSSPLRRKLLRRVGARTKSKHSTNVQAEGQKTTEVSHSQQNKDTSGTERTGANAFKNPPRSQHRRTVSEVTLNHAKAVDASNVEFPPRGKVYRSGLRSSSAGTIRYGIASRPVEASCCSKGAVVSTPVSGDMCHSKLEKTTKELSLDRTGALSPLTDAVVSSETPTCNTSFESVSNFTGELTRGEPSPLFAQLLDRLAFPLPSHGAAVESSAAVPAPRELCPQPYPFDVSRRMTH
ncbi:hypothetical protein, conserved [Trypanosoma brucei gambiense DAL972]|uniref:Uncharacterized protein n=1 Tax=Trypanosoma brucei gambiense (strain MHOM/CI/86/DAL972) TaxID=679716 RepID=C9ZLQ3_TRYB9|nr:hypothetical protein, conserved [Trypanosoma brucei gambiense DAL972]CBH10328.1 hypothetical protein, conserved [Trypanosoma brucei gambiense DAL972]|eukprot:XP_011772618.1 hypothetical protein, conserved [Trypanosoma brucei gambiense DAL972]